MPEIITKSLCDGPERERRNGAISEDEIKRIAEEFVGLDIEKNTEDKWVELIKVCDDGRVLVKHSNRWIWRGPPLTGLSANLYRSVYDGKLKTYEGIESVLCLSCQALGEKGLHFGQFSSSCREKEPQQFSLGLLKDIQSRHYCALCRTVCKALPRELWGSWLIPKGGDTKLMLLQKETASQYDITEGCHMQNCDCTHPYQYKAPALGEIYVGSEARNRYCSKEVRRDVEPLSDVRPKFATIYPGPGVLYTERFGEENQDAESYLRRLRDAWGVCERSHQACGQLVPKAKAPEGLMLIDIRRRCIESVAPGTRYIALSYVWGRVKMLECTVGSLKELKRPGSLVQNAGKIPQTIRDAMAVTEALGERYLWVDSLCIVQDDAVRKHDQIAKMNIIYGQAALTLIAMRGEDANSKLFEANRRSYWQDFSYERIVGGGAVAARAPWLSPLLFASHYNKRGWTFQERILSARCLYFTEKTIYFQCPQALCTDEGFLLEGENLSQDLALLNPLLTGYGKQSQATTKKQRKPKGKQQMVSFEDEQLLVYTNMVHEYSAKRLSYESDILNAFEGIAQYIFEGSSPVICGLPERDFDAALLWFPQGAVTRRTTADNIELGLSNSTYIYPSWAWIGWKGNPAAYIIRIFEEVSSSDNAALQSCIERFRISTSRAQKPRLLDITRKMTARMPLGVPSHTPVVDISDQQMVSYKLIFFADVVSSLHFKIRAPMGDEIGKSGNLKIASIIDSKNRHCGVLVSCNPLLAVTTFHDNLNYFEWILLSLNQDLAFRTPWQDLLGKAYDNKFFVTRKWCTANVMLIQWKGKTAERVGLGIVHIDPWEEVCIENKEITLA